MVVHLANQRVDLVAVVLGGVQVRLVTPEIAALQILAEAEAEAVEQMVVSAALAVAVWSSE